MRSEKAYVIRYGGKRFALHYTSDVDVAVKEGGGVGRFQELKLLEQITSMRLGGTYVDVGANVGNHTLYFANFTPADLVVAIEAHPKILSVLESNVARNPKVAMVHVRTFAAWESEGFAHMGSPIPGNAGRSQLDGLGKFGGRKHRVRTARLDDRLQDLEDITLMKMDIEDAEIPALRGARRILAEHNPVLITEHHTEQQLKQAKRILFPLGYELQGQTYDPRGETKLWLPS